MNEITATAPTIEDRLAQIERERAAERFERARDAAFQNGQQCGRMQQRSEMSGLEMIGLTVVTIGGSLLLGWLISKAVDAGFRTN